MGLNHLLSQSNVLLLERIILLDNWIDPSPCHLPTHDKMTANPRMIHLSYFHPQQQIIQKPSYDTMLSYSPTKKEVHFKILYIKYNVVFL